MARSRPSTINSARNESTVDRGVPTRLDDGKIRLFVDSGMKAFDREGKLRAICGGGRYDRLLSTFGYNDIPACGFGFGDAVILELLKEKDLLPDVLRHVDDIVLPLDEELAGPASKIASSLRKEGRSVDIIEDKRLKWVFKHAEKINAKRLILVGNTEWQRGMVIVKNLASREELQVKIDEVASLS